MRQAVVNADDFGICAETNLAIELAFRRGILTSASLLPNMPGFEHALGTVLPRATGLGTGIHLVLTSGHSVADPAAVPLLVDRRGLFRRTFLGVLALTSGPRSRSALAQIECELRAQFEKVRAAHVPIDHVNSHQHVHMIPAVWKIVARLAAEHGYRLARLGRPADQARRHGSGAGLLSGNLLKQVTLAACAVPTRRFTPEGTDRGAVVRHPDRLAAAMNRRGMDRAAFAARLDQLPSGITEFVTHPSLATMSSVAALAGSLSREDLMFLSSPGRRLELDALMDPQVRTLFAKSGVELVSFRSLARPARPAAAS